MKERLDKLIARRGILESREKARALIMGGSITVNGETIRKPSALVNTGASIQVRRTHDGYVSRGGLKLEKALGEFGISVSGKLCLDIGASTGGFTECLLRFGAAGVTALDVGKNQIAYRLRMDPRVTVIEDFNARYIDRLQLNTRLDIVTIDVSFISVTYILKPLACIIDKNTDVVVLIKPQFELGKSFNKFRGEFRGRFRGVVRDMEVHRKVLKELHGTFSTEGYTALGYTFSPLRGPKGNIEYFAHLKKADEGALPGEECSRLDRPFSAIIDMVVSDSHGYFRKKQQE